MKTDRPPPSENEDHQFKNHFPFQQNDTSCHTVFAVLTVTLPKLHVVYFSTGRNKRLQDMRVTEMLWDLCLS